MVARALPTPPDSSPPLRTFGRFELRRLLGRSAAAMVWLAFDPRRDSEVMLTLPRARPEGAAALEDWQREAHRAARLSHPNLAPVVEIGAQEQWPFVAVDRSGGVTLGERLSAQPAVAPAEAAEWVCELLQGLAFAHDAGIAHLDLQLHSVLIDERGGARLMALAAAGDAPRPSHEGARQRTLPMDPGELRSRRDAASRDLLACGLLLHRLLAGRAPLDEPDTARVIDRLAPLGRDLVRLPWTTPLPIAEALRAIANRCTASQARLRYRSSRTLLAALTGWLEAGSEEGGGPVALLLDRLRTVGHLPALPGLAARVARVTSLESQRTDEIADQVLGDMALSFELLRTLNSAQVQGTQVQGNGPVLTLRRIIALIGVNGVRLAANTLRTWPGPLAPPQAAALQATLDRVRLAGHTAQALRPAGYDAQVVYLIAALQNLGRLMLRYHFADEAEQIDQLMQSAARDGDVPEQAGLGESAAAYAVLGVEVDALGTAVAHHWGLGDDVMHMARRLGPAATVRKPDTDAEVLRLTASAANDAVDAVSGLSPASAAHAIGQIAQRYARALNVDARGFGDALQAARAALQRGTALPPARRGDSRLDATLDDPAIAADRG
jgi:eukaryotic-like serine/threonine-protein kinase